VLSGTIAALAATLVLASVAAAAPPAATTAPAGLDSLSDGPLLSELASRGLGTLLEHAFVVDNVPPDQQAAYRIILNLHDLTEPTHPLPPRLRRQRIDELAASIDPGLAAATDPTVLVEMAERLIRSDVDLDVNTLEYWGEDPALEAQVLTAAQTVVKMLERARQIAQQQADEVANSINSPDSPLAKRWMQLGTLIGRATYDRYMSVYYIAMGMDPAADRASVISDAIRNLQQFDDPAMEVQSELHLRIGKMYMAAGDYTHARQFFAGVSDPHSTLIRPPTEFDRFTAFYFSAVTELLAGQLDDARDKLDALSAWSRTTLSETARPAAEAAEAVLQYRIDVAAARHTSDPATRSRMEAAAVEVLQGLLKTQPSLRPFVLERLVDRMNPSTDPHSMDTLLLQAVVERTRSRLTIPSVGAPMSNPSTAPADGDMTAITQRGLAAARELVGRADADPQVVADTQWIIAYMLERLGHSLESAGAFLDYAQHYSTSPDAVAALDEATRQAFSLARSTPDSGPVADLIDRVYSVSLASPFNRTEFTYDYARRLLRAGKYAMAIERFNQIPASDKRWIDAQFLATVAMKDRLDDRAEKLTGTARQTLVASVLDRAAQIKSRADTSLTATTEPAQRQLIRSVIARTVLIAADLARTEQKDPAKVLQALDGFESLVAGLDESGSLLGEALALRVQAYMAAGNHEAAAAQLVAFLRTTGGAQGSEMIRSLLVKLGDDLDRARAAGDAPEMRKLAGDRATLSDFLVTSIAASNDPKIQSLAYRYKVLDADSHRLAASLEPDASRRAALQSAQQLYESLITPQNVAAYRASLDPASGVDPSYPDPMVSLGLGLIAFDLGDWKQARDRLGQLLYDKKLGGAVIIRHDPGTNADRESDNDAYWEAVYKLLRANVNLIQAGDTETSMQYVRGYLENQYILWESRTGGMRWHGAFEQLRHEIAPDFVPPAAAPVATSPR
jgi:hypothetical protein